MSKIISKKIAGISVFIGALIQVGCNLSPLTPSVASVASSTAVIAGRTVQFLAKIDGNPVQGVIWFVNGTEGGSTALGTISPTGLYTAPEVATPTTFLVSARSKADGPFSSGTPITVLLEGQITATQHPLVANYAFAAPPGSSVQIEFGLSPNYGRRTWIQNAPSGGGEVDVLVAGMRADTLYHMRARVILSDGGLFLDDDRTFTTGDVPTDRLPKIVTQTMPRQTPQPGIESVDLAGSTISNGILAVMTELDGSVIWYYDAPIPGQQNPTLTPIKLLPNGHLLLGFNDVGAGLADGQYSVMREVDLTGKVFWQMTYNDLNNLLATATCVGCNVTIIGTHHDFALLPNGHLIILATEDKYFSSVDGYPNGTDVVGDVVIDLDENRKPVWIWSTFDHLDPNRHLMGLPDWTHSNSIVYSPDDHNLILSIRHQSWVVKIDYRDGNGTGNILWRLGYQGDFTLLNGTDPMDWQYAQHDFNVISTNSSGVFDALLFDNGDLRVLDSTGTVCGGAIPCYSRALSFQIDESAKTASIIWSDAPGEYSNFGGSDRVLPNGDVEFDECAGPAPGPNAAVFEVTHTTPPQTVWQMQILDQYGYRVFRIPSLYPGIQW